MESYDVTTYTTTAEYLHGLCALPLFQAKKLKSFFETQGFLPYVSPHAMQEAYCQEFQQVQLSFALSCANAKEIGTPLPLYELISKKKLSRLCVHFIMLTIAWDISPDLFHTVKEIPPFHDLKGPTIELAQALYGICSNENPHFFHSAFTANKALLQLFFVFAQENAINGTFRFHTAMKAFLLGDTFRVPDFCQEIFITHEKEPVFSPDIFVIKGAFGMGKRRYLQKYFAAKEENCVFCDTYLLSHKSGTDWKNALQYIMLTAYLHTATICFLHFDTVPETLLHKIYPFLKQLQENKINLCITVLDFVPEGLLARFYCHVKEMQPLSYQESYQLLQKKCTSLSETMLCDVTDSFTITPRQIIAAAKEISFLEAKDKKSVFQCCFKQSGVSLSQIAEQIPTVFSWDDLVLSENLKKEIYQSCLYIKHSRTVYDTWGFSQRIHYGKGLNLLFAGPSGTGKTMLAQIIAGELGMPLYRIDLSAIVSKYIGETEKNLDRLFEEAQKGCCVLFFDEMDALFGKRSEIQDARDKYANMETAYLLQRLESYNGVVLMATNYLSNIDEAFMRRIHFVFHIPFPDAALRRELWQKVFPAEAPLGSIDYDFLSENFALSGASIKNIAVSAAVFAASKQSKITMEEILFSLRIELEKQNKTVLKKDFGAYYYILED